MVIRVKQPLHFAEAQRLEGSRFATWQLYRSAASGSRERLQMLPWPSAYLGTSLLSGQNIDRPLKQPLRFIDARMDQSNSRLQDPTCILQSALPREARYVLYH